MTKEESWLFLHRAPQVGPVTAAALLERYGSVEGILSQSNNELKDSGILKKAALDYLEKQDLSIIKPDLEWLAQDDCHLLTLDDDLYPQLLREIYDPPTMLYLRGNPDFLKLPQLAIVGSRTPTPSGAEVAKNFAQQIANCGLAITSGMALGIDSAAHQGALRANNGVTIAVVGTGLDRVYPARNHKLAQDIAQQGVLVSEFPIGTAPKAENFPRRNRIISGLATGVLVVEAALKSGSLISARYAMEQGREVFAIPGSINNPLARGSHHLIKQGAKLVEQAEDLLEELSPLVGISTKDINNTLDISEKEPQNSADKNKSSSQSPIFEHIGYDPVHIDHIITKSGLTVDKVSAMMIQLELQGEIESLPGGKFQRI